MPTQLAAYCTAPELTVAQVAELKGCSLRYIRKLADEGVLPAEKRLNERKRPTYYMASITQCTEPHSNGEQLKTASEKHAI